MTVVLRMEEIRKVFPGVVALDGVNIALKKGQVLGLMGENGAGKSTLMKVLSGTYHPDGGRIYIDGRVVEIESVNDAKKLGISIIYQELSLSANMTVAENIYSMIEPLKYGLIDDDELNRKTKEYLESMNIDIKPTTLVQDLSLANQQMVEIAKGIVNNPKILIMDEPTSALSSKETEALMQIIRKLKENGCAIIYISHRIEEIFEITDEISVLRDGKYIGTLKTREAEVDELISMMVGREMEEIYPPKEYEYRTENVLLSVENYTKESFYEDISFTLHEGEILGIYGLMGSGRTEIAQGIFGILPKDKGNLTIKGKPVKINTTHQAIKNKIAFVTENRKDEGLVLTASVEENITLANLDHILGKLKLIDAAKEKDIADKYVDSLRIKTPSVFQTVNNLSGGNQQKVVLSKWFEINPDILILDEPTRGIDVGAKFEIYSLINELAKSGVGILLISSELPEVLNMADRILVVKDHRIIKVINTNETNQEEIMGYITKVEAKEMEEKHE